MSGSERNLEGPPFVTGVSKTATQRPQGTKLQCVLFQGLVFTRGGVLLRPMGTRTDGFWVGGAQTSREKKRVRATYYQNETADGTSYKAWRERKRDHFVISFLAASESISFIFSWFTSFIYSEASPLHRA